jgi:GMP synthase (glutamine-hydrolysing)
VHDDDKDPDHVRAKVRVAELFAEVFKRKMPVLGICFSSQMALHLLSPEPDVVRYMQNTEGERSGEDGLVTLTRTAEGQTDIVLGKFPNEFRLVASHVQEVDPQKLPAGSVLLASSKDCSVQIVRMHEHMVFVQSHPETAWAWVAAAGKHSTKPGEMPKPLSPELMDSQTIAHGEVIFSGFLDSVQQYVRSK